jgi:hypothetical protein
MTATIILQSTLRLPVENVAGPFRNVMHGGYPSAGKTRKLAWCIELRRAAEVWHYTGSGTGAGTVVPV